MVNTVFPDDKGRQRQQEADAIGVRIGKMKKKVGVPKGTRRCTKGMEAETVEINGGLLHKKG